MEITNAELAKGRQIARLVGEPPTVCLLHDGVLAGMDDALRFTHDATEVIAITGSGAAHAADAVIVGGDSERPTTQRTMGAGEIFRSGLCGRYRIETVIDSGGDGHV